MRITENEKNTICNAVNIRDTDAKIYLFGSRADDSKKGGDIDLLVISQELSQKDIRKIRRNIIDQIGEQKIDIILAKNLQKPFTKIAANEGVLL
jgi:predicted nucleotidyltransferase